MPEKKGLYLDILVKPEFTFNNKFFEDRENVRKIQKVMQKAIKEKNYPSQEQMIKMLSNVSCGQSGTANGGLSERNASVFVEMSDPKCQLYTNHLNVPEVKIGGKNDYVYFEPIEPVPKEEVGWMMGGAYIQAPEGTHGSDAKSRECFMDMIKSKIKKEKELVNLHDRKETWEQYEALSR